MYIRACFQSLIRSGLEPGGISPFHSYEFSINLREWGDVAL
jgi:hypothetical protein